MWCPAYGVQAASQAAPAEREKEETQNIMHKNSQQVYEYSVFCHAARLLHAPRRDKIHVPAHLMANC